MSQIEVMFLLQVACCKKNFRSVTASLFLLIVLSILLEIQIYNDCRSPAPSALSPSFAAIEYEQYQYVIGNQVCELLFPSSLMFLFHHKTGTQLASKLRHIILSFCEIRYSKPAHESYDAFIQWLSFRSNLSTVFGDPDPEQQQRQSDNIKIHFIRDPLLTIVSGYKYHMKCRERWASDILSTERLSAAQTFFNGETNVSRITSRYLKLAWTFEFDREIPVWRDTLTTEQWSAMLSFYGKHNQAVIDAPWSAIRQLYLYYLNDIVNNIDLKGYGDFYGFHLDFDDARIHRRFNIFRGDKSQNFEQYESINAWYSSMLSHAHTAQYGLFYEMVRYLFVVFPEIYDYHAHKMGDDNSNELRMEVWQHSFQQNANKLLGVLNIIDNQQNRNTLKQHGLFGINITQQRHLLLQQMSKQDVSQLSPEPRQTQMTAAAVDNELKQKIMKYVTLKRRRFRAHDGDDEIDASHVHIARNNTKYVDILLSIDHQICLLLKHITVLIRYEWQHFMYC